LFNIEKDKEMHTPKFQVGDIISMDITNPYSFTVIEIVIGEKEVIGKWGYNSILIVRDSYVVEDCQDFMYCRLPFCEEHLFRLIHRPDNTSLALTQIQIDLCPRCKKELKDQFSEYTKSYIKKCSDPKCGWC
jgi:hypothetical protein